MKHKALAIGLVAAALNAGLAFADYRVAPNASFEERQRYESDHVAAGRYHTENAQARTKEQNERIRQPSPFTETERRWFNQTNGYHYGNCGRSTTWPCN